MSEEMKSESTMVVSNVIICSICLDVVVDGVGRGTTFLACGHRFHLDCISSAFNYDESMQCPNCYSVENGGWLAAWGSTRSMFTGWNFHGDPSAKAS